MDREASEAGGGRRGVWGRYLLFQAPGWIAAGAGLFFVASRGWLDAPWPLLLFAGLVVKDLVLYPWMRIAYEPSTLHGLEALQRSGAIVDTALTPVGTVRVGPERWRARWVGQAAGVSPGERVRIRDVEGLTLLVDSVDPSP